MIKLEIQILDLLSSKSSLNVVFHKSSVLLPPNPSCLTLATSYSGH